MSPWLSYRNFYTIRNSADWYKVHLEIFEKHPFAALYYGLQCTDRNVKTRIGQDYAFSDKLASSCLPEILGNLLSSYVSDDTPYFLKSSMLRIAKEILISVHPDKWEEQFMQIWKEKVLREIKNLNDPRFPELREFVFQALDCMRSRLLRQGIVADILTHCRDEESFAVNSLYYIRHEGLEEGNEKLSQAINEFISALIHPWQIAVAGNVMSMLTAAQKDVVRQKISEMLDTKVFNDLSFGSAQHFIAAEDYVLRDKYVNSILRSPLLWKTGILEDGHYSSAGESFLSVTSYTSIRFTTSAIVSIYQRLKECLAKICSSRVFQTPFYHIMSLEGVLLEMLTFLDQNSAVLDIQSDFEEIISRVRDTYRKTQDVHSVEEGLLSIYPEELQSALDYLYSNRKEISHDRFISLMNLVLNRVLLMNNEGVDKCLRKIRY